AAVQGDYLVMLHSGNVLGAVIDLKKKEIARAYQTAGLAIYGDILAAETAGGAMALQRFGETKNLDQTRMPYGPLHSARVTEFSSNGKWLAVSEPSRGAVYELGTGQRLLFIVGFEGGFFDNDELLAKFPRHNADPPRVGEFSLPGKTEQVLYQLNWESA